MDPCESVLVWNAASGRGNGTIPYAKLKVRIDEKATDVKMDDDLLALPESVQEYVSRFAPVTVLRHNVRANTFGLDAMNIGVAKGGTFDRVLIIPTKRMTQFLGDLDAARLEYPESLYVAVTRARFSVAFVVDRKMKYLPYRWYEP